MQSSPSTSTTTTLIAHTGVSIFRARCREPLHATGRWCGGRCWVASTTSMRGRLEIRMEYFPPTARRGSLRKLCQV